MHAENQINIVTLANHHSKIQKEPQSIPFYCVT